MGSETIVKTEKGKVKSGKRTAMHGPMGVAR